MILEVATLDVKIGQHDDFEVAFKEAESIIFSMKGYISHQLQKCMEVKNRYVLLVRWETLEDHTEGFRGSEEYEVWREKLHHFYEPFPEVVHYELVSERIKS